MPTYRRPKQTASWWSTLLLIVFALLIGGVGTVGTLAATGAVDLSALAFWRAREPQVPPGAIAVPISARPIPAYTKVTRDHLFNANTGKFAFVYLMPDEIQPQMLVKMSDVIGRVLDHDKPAGYAFTERDFLPDGTREGIAGATPPGMRSITLDAAKLTGVHALGSGDHVDLLANVGLDQMSAFHAQAGRLPSGEPVPGMKPRSSDKSSATQTVLLAQDAVVLKPVYVRNEVTTTASLTQGKRLQSVPKYEVAIAVAPEDVIPLQNALNNELKITCVAHSMRPNDGAHAATQDPGLAAPVTVRPVLAYAVVTREAFIDPATRGIRTQPVTREQVERLGIVTSLTAAIGAVARHDIPAGSILTQRDLLSGTVQPEAAPPVTGNGSERNTARQNSAAGTPVTFATHRAARTATQEPTEGQTTPPGVVGDRPAVSRLVPPGYTAFAIPWNRLYGAEHLQIEDRIDLLVSYSLESEDEEEETETRPDGTKIVRKRTDIATRQTLRTWDESFGFRGEPWFVASGAIVVGPVGFPAPAPAQRALGDALNQPPSREATALGGPPVIVAVDDRDVEAVASALATKRALFTPALHGAEESDSGDVRRVAVAAQDLPAYELLSETVWQGNRRQPASRLVRARDPRFAAALDIDQIAAFYGRVLKRPLRKGEVFTADDFLPEGAAPGVASGVGPGATVFAVPDREIEGLDNFADGDRVAILVRGVVKAPEGVIAHGFNWERPIARTVAPEAHILRASRGGQTVLEVPNEHLAQLQAVWAASMTDRDGGGQRDRRSHLLAVGLPRSAEQHSAAPGVAQLSYRQTQDSISSGIPDFDPAVGVRMMETVVGSRVRGFCLLLILGCDRQGKRR